VAAAAFIAVPGKPYVRLPPPDRTHDRVRHLLGPQLHQYVPREETPEGLAGGRVLHVQIEHARARGVISAVDIVRLVASRAAHRSLSAPVAAEDRVPRVARFR
jgi:hypothetical protein